MTKAKFDSLTKYSAQLADKLADKEIPAKHLEHPKTYKAFLEKELNFVKKQLATAKEVGLTK